MFNRQAQQLLGYNGDELLRSPVADLYADVPEGKAKAQELFHRFLAGHEIRGAELAMRRADGELVWVGLTVRTIFDSNGDVAESRSMLVDITEQKKAERELQLSNARLEETLSALTETQQQIVQQERLRALGQMASGVAHDFNNLLTPIVGYSELLLTSPQHLGDQDTVERYVRLINTAGQDAANVVKNLREFYREHDSREDFVPIALGELIQQAISLTQAKWKDQAQAGGKTITIETDFNPVPPVCGSQTQLREVLINLIINATDAITSDGTITLRVYADGAQVALDVADTGSGMTEGVRRQCLDPFFTTKGSVGTGLGLATAAGAIRRHGGSIDVATKEGEGTTFTIRIPIHADELGDADNEVTEPTFAPAMRVLVVDDEETVRGLLADYLRADGHTVETAADGREGLERYCAGSFDLVVTDRAMPEMNGDQLAEAIRKERRAAYIIMLTGYGDSFRADKEFPNGVDFVLNKPIRRKELRQALVAVAG